MTDDEVLAGLNFHPFGDEQQMCQARMSCGCVLVLEEWFALQFMVHCLDKHGICPECGCPAVTVKYAQVLG